jgi:hypothetical protein
MSAKGEPRDAALVQIEEEHALLRELFEVVSVAARSAGDVETVPELMGSLLAELKNHFHMEEVDGIFDQVDRDAPQLAHEVHQLRVEHVELLDEAANLAELSRCVGDARRRQQFEHLFRRFRERVEWHEAHENGVLQRTYCEDMGTDD